MQLWVVRKMWTEREKYISEHNEIKEYLEAMDAFHDYRIGNIEVADNYVILTIEEIVPAKHIADTAGQIWDFKFEEVIKLKMNNDCVGAFFIDEITMEDGAIIFSCTNGCIQIKAAHIQIGIPSVRK